MLKLHHIALHTKDTQKSIEFYSKFGATVIDQAVTFVANRPGYSWKLTMLQVTDFVIELKELNPVTEMSQSDDGFFNHICLETNDVEALVLDLKKKGINSFIEPILRKHTIYSPGGIKNAFLRGPDGEQIELIEYQ